MYKSYFFIQGNRMRKKWAIYKQYLLLSFDLTTVLYGGAFLAYLLIALSLHLKDTMADFSKFLIYEEMMLEYLPYIMLILPLIYLMNAIKRPGLLFSKAEYQLSVLPYLLKNVWLLTALLRWVKFTAFILLFLCLYVLFFKTTSLLILFVYIIYLDLLMTIIRWKFFQQKLWKKLTIILIYYLLIFSTGYLPIKIINVFLILTLTILAIFLSEKIGDNIDWDKVIAISDYHIWHMPIITYGTKVKFQREKSVSLLQSLTFWKRAFKKERVMYNRLWFIYFEKNFGPTIKFTLSLLALQVALIIVQPKLFMIGIFLAIYIYSSYLSAIFLDRLQSDLLEIIPWQIEQFKKTFCYWIIPLSGFMLSPLFIYSLWMKEYILLLYFLAGLLLLITLIFSRISELLNMRDKQIQYSKLTRNLLYLCMLCLLVASYFY